MKKKFLIIFPLFLLCAALSFFGLSFFLKTWIFKVPGVLTFSDSFPESEKSFYEDLLKETELDKNLNLKISTSLSARETSEKSYLLDIFVPTTDFYDSKNSIDVSSLTEKYTSSDLSLIPIEKLTNKVKLLAVKENGAENYFLDTFSSGAIFKYLDLETDSEKDLETFKALISPNLKTFPEKSNTLSLLQTGVTALARRMNAKLAEVEAEGKTASYFTENIAEFLNKFDLTHTSSESSFSERATSVNICSDPAMVDVFKTGGIDIVELTGNHNLDCGAEAALETLETYKSLGIKTFGGGEDAEDAKKPLEIIEKGNKFTLFGFNESTGGATTGDYPGANQFYEDSARAEIAAEKEKGNLVIVDVQYYECSEYVSEVEDTTCDAADSSAGDQVGFFRDLIDMGADLVIGTSAHQPQTFEIYNNGIIFYGLGNLFFDQSWWPGTTRSLAVASYIYNNQLIQNRIFGTVYDDNYQPELMSEEDLTWFLDRLSASRP